MDRVSATNDLAFKKVLASEENIDILQGLIADFYEIEVENLKINNPYSIAEYKEILDGKDIAKLRQTIKDVSASFKIADFVAELQVRASRFFDERAIYYPFDRFCKNFNKTGEMVFDSQGRLNRYSSLRPVYALNILGYTHFKKCGRHNDDNALHIFELYDVKNQRLYNNNLIKIGFFELTKNEGLTVNQRHWQNYFNTGVVDVSAPEYIKKAGNVIEFTNMAEEEKLVIEALQKDEAIRIAENQQSFIDGRQEGFLDGRQEGFLDGIAKVAKSLIEDGEPIEKIMRHTGLSEVEINSLQTSVKYKRI